MLSTTDSILNNNIDFVHIGVDLAKKVFQVAYQNPVTKKFVNRQFKRSEFIKFLTDKNSFKKHIYVESCGACQYWCRLAESCGHKGTVIPAAATKTFISNNKSDYNDAKAIWQLSFVPDIKSIRVRSESNQVQGMLLKCREKLLTERTKITNWLRGQLYELGEIASLGGCSKVLPLSEELLAKAKESNKDWSDIYEQIHSSIKAVIEMINEQLKILEDFIKQFVSKDKLCQKFLTIPYVGIINAYALSYVMEDPKYYKNGRQFASHAGVTPSFTGTGGETHILGVGRKGSSILKRTMFQSNLSMFTHNKVNCEDDPELKEKRKTNSLWISQLAQRLPMKKAVCAISNKMARVAWAVAADDKCSSYDESKTSLLYSVKTESTKEEELSADELLLD